MKKVFLSALSVIVALLIALTPAAASARVYYSLSDMQSYLMTHSPQVISALFDKPELFVIGTILELTHTGPNNHWDMVLSVASEKAMIPTGYDTPVCHVHFRLHLDDCPFAVGDEISVQGAINELYSSVMIPWIIADEINGSEDF